MLTERELQISPIVQESVLYNTKVRPVPTCSSPVIISTIGSKSSNLGLTASLNSELACNYITCIRIFFLTAIATAPISSLTKPGTAILSHHPQITNPHPIPTAH